MHSKCVEMHSNANFIKPGFPKEGHIFTLKEDEFELFVGGETPWPDP